MAKAVATVEDFDKLKNPDTGLVPMKFLVDTITDRVGEIQGVEPRTALRWYNDGLAEPAKGTVKASGEAKQPATAKESDEDGRKSAIAIAPDWENLHHLQRISLARNIVGKGNDEKMTAEDADKVIKAELERRGPSGNSDVGPNAVTSAKTVTP